jgi:hypothetical protein
MLDNDLMMKTKHWNGEDTKNAVFALMICLFFPVISSHIRWFEALFCYSFVTDTRKQISPVTVLLTNSTTCYQ